MKVGGGAKVVYYLISNIRKDSLVKRWSRWVRSGNTFKRRRVLSVINWEGENESWDGMRPCWWFLGGKLKMLKYVRRGWVVSVV